MRRIASERIAELYDKLSEYYIGGAWNSTDLEIMAIKRYLDEIATESSQTPHEGTKENH